MISNDILQPAALLLKIKETCGKRQERFGSFRAHKNKIWGNCWKGHTVLKDKTVAVLCVYQQQPSKHRCPERLSPWVHLQAQQQPLLPPLPFSPPQVLLQFPLEEGVFFGGVGGLECPRLYPHLSHPNPSSPLRSLFMPLPSPFQAPPWGR